VELHNNKRIETFAKFLKHVLAQRSVQVRGNPGRQWPGFSDNLLLGQKLRDKAGIRS
jgi:hypothetical protein